MTWRMMTFRPLSERELGGGKLRACTHKIANGDSNLIKVRFGALCGLRRRPQCTDLPIEA
jgi:hypothetical protein